MQNPVTNNRPFGLRASLRSITVAVGGALALGWLGVAAAQDVAHGTLAAAIRSAGYPCARVLEKERASEGSSVWRVKCNSGRFSVTMDGDSASAVTPID